MKKAVSLITAAALAAGTFGTMTANASDNDGRYEYAYEHGPYLYFKVDEGQGHIKLSDNFIYVNRKKAPEDGEIIRAEVYLYDYTKKVCNIVVHLYEETGKIVMRNGYDPVKEYGATPFRNYNGPEGHPTYKPPFGHPNGMTIAYQSTGLGYYPLTGENTNDYPLGIFDMSASKDTPCGTYFIECVPPEFTLFQDGTFTFSKYSEVAETETDENDQYVTNHTFKLNKCFENIQINVSDRDLGDTDENGKVDDEDASDIFFIYECRENGFDVMDVLVSASDVNGDREIDSDDIEMVMDYTLLYGDDEQPAVSFVDYVKEQIGEE